MSSDGKIDTPTVAATGPAATSESPPMPGPSASPGAMRLRNLGALLLRENVEFVLVLGGARSVKVLADMGANGKDSKVLDVGAEGCLVLVKLSDNPAGVGAGFYDLSLDVGATRGGQ